MGLFVVVFRANDLEEALRGLPRPDLLQIRLVVGAQSDELGRVWCPHNARSVPHGVFVAVLLAGHED